jgi:hypothetical protein
MPVIPAIEKQRQEDHEFEDNPKQKVRETILK